MSKLPVIMGSRAELEQQLVLLHAEGQSARMLARRFGVSRNTVRGILARHGKERREGQTVLKPKLRRASKLDSFAPQIADVLAKYPKISAQRVFEKLKDAGYDGGITMVRERLARVRPREKEPVVRFETEPGQQGQMDWSPYTIRFTRAGKQTVQCFSYILGYSRRQYIDFTERHDFFTLIRRHQDAFEYFGGAPAECLYDNEKTVVLRWECGRPVYNPKFSQFITHFLCRPIACLPRTPETKGKVERPFQYVEGNFLAGREFEDLEDLRRQRLQWLAEKNDLRIHATTGESPLARFGVEQSHLRPLPAHSYDTSEVALRVCDSEGFVVFETNRYSAPSQCIADILTLKASEREIEIYNPELVRVARHERQRAGAGLRIADPEHFRPKKDRYGLEPVREAFLSLGVAAEAYLRGLIEKHPKNAGAHARHILRMKETYLSADIHQALEHALKYLAHDGGAIERILKAKATPRTLESISAERASERLAELPRFTQRPLKEYTALLKENPNEAECIGKDDAHANQESPGDAETDGN